MYNQKRWSNCAETWPEPRTVYLMLLWYRQVFFRQCSNNLRSLPCRITLHAVLFFAVLFFLKIKFFGNKILLGIQSVCQTVLIQIRPDISGLIWIKAVCKVYLQPPLETNIYQDFDRSVMKNH